MNLTFQGSSISVLLCQFSISTSGQLCVFCLLFSITVRSLFGNLTFLGIRLYSQLSESIICYRFCSRTVVFYASPNYMHLNSIHVSHFLSQVPVYNRFFLSSPKFLRCFMLHSPQLKLFHHYVMDVAKIRSNKNLYVCCFQLYNWALFSVNGPLINLWILTVVFVFSAVHLITNMKNKFFQMFQDFCNGVAVDVFPLISN